MTEIRTHLPRRHDPRLPAHRRAPRAQARRRGALGRHASTRTRSRRPPRELRRATRERLAGLGLGRTDSSIPETFSFYDQVLDAAIAVGALPERFAGLRAADGSIGLAAYFTVARGAGEHAPLEMTKWFDTNYHYLVPEIGPETVFALSSDRFAAQVAEARADGFTDPPRHRRPGDAPRARQGGGCRARGLPARSTVSTTCCRCTPSCSADLRAAGAEWVQLDEPALVSESLPYDRGGARGCRSPRLRGARRRGRSAGDPRRRAVRPALGRRPRRARRGSRRGDRASTSTRGSVPRGRRRSRRPRRSSAASSTAATSGAVISARPGRRSRRCAVSAPPRCRVGTSTSLQHVPHDVADEPDARPAPRDRGSRSPTRRSARSPPSRAGCADGAAAIEAERGGGIRGARGPALARPACATAPCARGPRP